MCRERGMASRCDCPGLSLIWALENIQEDGVIRLHSGLLWSVLEHTCMQAALSEGQVHHYWPRGCAQGGAGMWLQVFACCTHSSSTPTQLPPTPTLPWQVGFVIPCIPCPPPLHLMSCHSNLVSDVHCVDMHWDLVWAIISLAELGFLGYSARP